MWALIFTAVVSRHMFVWLSFRQTLEDVIAGCEAAWAFFDGVFAVVILDNLKAIVDQADPLDPRINTTFLENARARGFVIDPARVRKPTDKPRVERIVPFTHLNLAVDIAAFWHLTSRTPQGRYRFHMASRTKSTSARYLCVPNCP